MCTKYEYNAKLMSLLDSFEMTPAGESRVHSALELFQYIAQPPVLEFYGNQEGVDYLGFRKTVLSKITELQQEPLVQQEPAFARAFMTIKKAFSDREYLREIALPLLLGTVPNVENMSPVSCLDGFVVQQIIESLIE